MTDLQSDETPEYHEDVALWKVCASAPLYRLTLNSTLIVGTKAASKQAQHVMV